MKNKTCGECKHFEVDTVTAVCEKKRWICDDDAPACNRFEQKPTLFDRITESPETAERKTKMAILKNGYTVEERKAPYENFFDIFDEKGKRRYTYTMSSDHVTLIEVYHAPADMYMPVERFFKSDVEMFRFFGWE